jgi:hypothetical protein
MDHAQLTNHGKLGLQPPLAEHLRPAAIMAAADTDQNLPLQLAASQRDISPEPLALLLISPAQAAIVPGLVELPEVQEAIALTLQEDLPEVLLEDSEDGVLPLRWIHV